MSDLPVTPGVPPSALPLVLRWAVNNFSHHILTGAGAALASAGLIPNTVASQNQVVTFLGALLLWVLGLGWSFLEKKATDKQVVAATNAPPPVVPVTTHTAAVTYLSRKG
jgi:hypothetical protein